MPDPTKLSEDLICVGVITGVHGIKGAVRIKSFTEDPCALAAYGPFQTGGRAGILELKDVRQAKGGAIVAHIKGIKGRNEAEALKGCELFIKKSDLPEPEDDEWYVTDLIGLKALSSNGKTVGEIVSVQNFGAGDLLEIKPPGETKTLLIPFTREVVPNVDMEKGEVIIDPPEGLI